jgi:hypothetical protein
VPEAGLEPAGPCEHRILSAARLPISPLRQTPDPILACSREPKKRLRSCPLARQARNGGRVVDPRQQVAGFTPGIAKHPVRATGARHSFRDRPVDSNQPVQAGSEPIDERSTGGHQRDIQAFIDVAWVLPGMVAIHVHNDGSVAIDTPASKVRKILIRDREWTEGSALCRRKTKAFDPPVKGPITPLQPVAPTSWPHWPHIRLKRQGRPQHVKEIQICGSYAKVAPILGEIPVRGE